MNKQGVLHLTNDFEVGCRMIGGYVLIKFLGLIYQMK